MCFLRQMGGQAMQPQLRPRLLPFQPNFAMALQPPPAQAGMPGTANYGMGPEHAFFPNVSISNPGGGPAPVLPPTASPTAVAATQKDRRRVYDPQMQAYRPAYAVRNSYSGDHGGSGNKGGSGSRGGHRGGGGIGSAHG